MNPWKQNYSDYTAEDQQVWKILYDRQLQNLTPTASRAFLDGIELINFRNEAIPDFEETNKLLKDLTGWNLHEVPGILPVKEFFMLLNKKKFSATTWLRKMSQLDYLEEPDMFHDVFAHAPMLTNKKFCDFFHGMSKIAMKHIDNPYALELLGRLYWFTIEFGLIEEKGQLKIYGAGILSSLGETNYCQSAEPIRVPYNIDEIFNTPFRTDVFQHKYFVIESYEELYASIHDAERLLEERLSDANYSTVKK